MKKDKKDVHYVLYFLKQRVFAVLVVKLSSEQNQGQNIDKKIFLV